MGWARIKAHLEMIGLVVAQKSKKHVILTFLFMHDLICKPLRTFQDHAFCLSMILSVNRYALFRIMHFV
jgi:hypothetical protein